MFELDEARKIKFQKEGRRFHEEYERQLSNIPADDENFREKARHLFAETSLKISNFSDQLLEEVKAEYVAKIGTSDEVLEDARRLVPNIIKDTIKEVRFSYRNHEIPQEEKENYNVTFFIRVIKDELSEHYKRLDETQRKQLDRTIIDAICDDEWIETPGGIAGIKALGIALQLDLDGESGELALMPSSEAMLLTFKSLTARNIERFMLSSKSRNIDIQSSEIEYSDNGVRKKGLVIKKTNQNIETETILELRDADKVLFNPSNKGFGKLLAFSLQEMTKQSFSPEVRLSLDEMVDLGMYSNRSHARRAVYQFFEQQTSMRIRGIAKVGKRTIREGEGFLFTNIEKSGSKYIDLTVNGKYNLDFISPFFTWFPQRAYKLKSNAFFLTYYLFYLARQHSKEIKDNGFFTISMDAIRQQLQLPDVSESKNRSRDITEPLEKAIEEINDTFKDLPEGDKFKLKAQKKTGDVHKWLKTNVKVELAGQFASHFTEVLEKKEKHLLSTAGEN